MGKSALLERLILIFCNERRGNITILFLMTQSGCVRVNSSLSLSAVCSCHAFMPCVHAMRSCHAFISGYHYRALDIRIKMRIMICGALSFHHSPFLILPSSPQPFCFPFSTYDNFTHQNNTHNARISSSSFMQTRWEIRISR